MRQIGCVQNDVSNIAKTFLMGTICKMYADSLESGSEV